jgi:hypothetical protein
MSFRKVHFADSEWRYKVHSQMVEIRNPQNKKFLVEANEITKYDEFKERMDIYDEYAYDPSISDDEFTMYIDKKTKKYFCIPRDKELANYFFGITPQRVKDFIIKNYDPFI